MSQAILKKKEERAKLVADARAIVDLAEKESRELTSEEEARQDAIFADVDKFDADIKRMETLARVEAQTRAREATPVATESEERTLSDELKKLHIRGLRKFLCGQQLSQTEIDAVRAVNDFYENRTMAAFNAAQSEMLAPQEFTTEIIKDVSKKVAVRQMAQVLTVNTLAGFHAPTLAEDTEEFDMTAELTSPQEAADITLGKRELRPHQATKMIKLPLALLQSSLYNIEALAQELLVAKRARTEDNKFCNGSGAQEPLGLFTASALGIPTSRDTVCGSATDFTWDGVLDCIAALREEFQPGAQFLLARNAWARLRKIKDGEGRYIWEPSVRVGEPDVIYGYPYQFSDFVPSTYTTGQYVGIFGNFKNYWILDFAFSYVQRLNELYALTNQVALVSRFWFDGAPVQPQAFVRMKLG